MATLPGFERYDFDHPALAVVPVGWDDSRIVHWDLYNTYSGPLTDLRVDVFTVPVIVPNIGIPFSDINVSSAMLNNFQDLIALASSAMGRHPMATACYEYRQNVPIGPDFLGWHFVVLSHEGPSAMVSPMAEGPMAFAAAGIVAVILTILASVAVFAFIDSATGGKLTEALNNLINQLSGGVSRVVSAPFSGYAWVLLVGIGLIGVLAIASPRLGISGSGAQAAERLLQGGAAVSTPVVGQVGTGLPQVRVQRRRGR